MNTVDVDVKSSFPGSCAIAGPKTPARIVDLRRRDAMISLAAVSKPATAGGGFFAMALDALVSIPRRPFAGRE